MESPPTSPLPPLTATTIHVACAQLSHSRRVASTTYSVEALVATAIAAFRCGQLHVLAITQWVARQWVEVRQGLALPAERTPHQSTFQHLFQRLDATVVAHTLASAFEQTTRCRKNEQAKRSRSMARPSVERGSVRHSRQCSKYSPGFATTLS